MKDFRSMDISNPPSPAVTDAPAPAAGFRLVVSVELILYTVLILAALFVRLPDLGTIPLDDREAHEALAVFRVLQPEAPGTVPLAYNPLMFSVNALTMAIGGTATATPRLPTVMLGVLIVAAPAAFRRWLGSANALIIAALLAISPVLLVASRTMGGAVWSLALALAALWLAGRYLESRRPWHAVAASTALLLLVLAAEPAGFLTFLGLAFGLAFALVTIDDPEGRYRGALGGTLSGWPWTQAVVFALLAIGAVGTVFLLRPEALGSIGEALGRGLRGFVFRPADSPLAFPLQISLLYEPLLWVFGLTGAYLTLRAEDNGPQNFLRRALVGWLITSLVWALFYPGAEAAHALWLTVPLAALSAIAIEKALTPVRDRFWIVPFWGPWLHAVGVVAMIAIAAVNLVYVGPNVLRVTPMLFPQLDQPGTVKLMMVVLSVVLLTITFFLVGSIWGSRAAWHGMGLGVLLFLAAYSLRAGWGAAVTRADDPREPWRLHPVSRNLNLLEATLRQASLRATGTPGQIEMLVQIPSEDDDDGALAWQLRNFPNSRFVTEIAPTTATPIVIALQAAEPPQLGASYVGQDFPITQRWDRSTLALWDVVPWLYDRQTRVGPVADQRVVVWVRADIYGVAPPAGSAPAPTQP